MVRFVDLLITPPSPQQKVLDALQSFNSTASQTTAKQLKLTETNDVFCVFKPSQPLDLERYQNLMSFLAESDCHFSLTAPLFNDDIFENTYGLQPLEFYLQVAGQAWLSLPPKNPENISDIDLKIAQELFNLVKHPLIHRVYKLAANLDSNQNCLSKVCQNHKLPDQIFNMSLLPVQINQYSEIDHMVAKYQKIPLIFFAPEKLKKLTAKLEVVIEISYHTQIKYPLNECLKRIFVLTSRRACEATKEDNGIQYGYQIKVVPVEGQQLSDQELKSLKELKVLQIQGAKKWPHSSLSIMRIRPILGTFN